ncbi:MAG: hypothetical protein DMD81_02725 [Candidatus Rokuibacteriota bacterium]|nr:MAG: hypothetical protein DMD81_02725 [Candidatus Rokubacteria bacterium]
MLIVTGLPLSRLLVADLEQVLEEGAVMFHGLPQVFGLGGSFRVDHGDPVRRAIVMDHAGVIHGDVRDALLEVADGIAARFHQVAHEMIGFTRSERTTIGVEREAGYSARSAELGSATYFANAMPVRRSKASM